MHTLSKNRKFDKTVKLAVLVLLFLYGGAAAAYGSLRCQSKIIRPGATMSQVLALCGTPRTRIVEEMPVRSRVVTGFSRLSGIAVTESWVYDRGWGKFPAVLIFRDNTLRRIDYLSYRSGTR